MAPLLGIHTTEMHCICSPNSYAKTPIAGGLRRAQSWKLFKWPLAIEWIIQLWYAASTDSHISKRWAMHNCSEWQTKSQATCVTKRKCGLWIHLHKLWKVPSQCELVFTCDSWGRKGCRRARGLWRRLLCSSTWFHENSSQVGLCILSVCSWHLSKTQRIKDQHFSTCETGRGMGARVS